tara:strand:+ start:1030 stop:1626 length:597 start_codon:yes stop_codon:yes gene_type:complete
MKIVAITGGIGSGKSKILNFFTKRGFTCYNSDEKAKIILNTNSLVKKYIIENFGRLSYKNGFLNSKYLSKIVFKDPEKLKQLNSIVHPLVEEDFKKFKIKSEKSIIFFESAILFESKINLKIDYTVLVTAPINIRTERIIKRDRITLSKILSRVSKQWSDEKKTLFADRLIENIDWKTTVIVLENLLIDLKNRFNIPD